jgi:hypothetical protein
LWLFTQRLLHAFGDNHMGRASMNIRRSVALNIIANIVPQSEGPKNLLRALYRSGVDVEQRELYLVSLELCG